MLALLRNRAYKKALTGRLDGSSPHADVPPGGRTEQLFTRAMFTVMGRLAKLDGRGTENEVSYASAIMTLMGLDTETRQQAINYFELGKQPSTDVMQWVTSLARVIGVRGALASLFLKIQCRSACVKGNMQFKERIMLRDIADVLGYSKAEFLAVCAGLQRPTDDKQIQTHSFLHNAYRILQLRPDVDDGEIRRAYLRMMSRNHPDKLVSDDLSEESLKRAQEKSMAIRTAYETVCGFRKIRA
jgi:DnaJ like chaperone protein